MLKRNICDSISTSHIDEIYDAARSVGAMGGKILGAGGGGFMILFAKPENQSAIKKRLNDLLYVPFNFEHSGSQIILNQQT
jgi:D-glycero-alpha-D-manno-heptose-7-phosphate kinase